MTKRTGGRRRRARRNGNAAGQKWETISGQQLFISTTNGALTQVPVAPSSFTRVLAIADSFSYYRFTKIKIEMLPSYEDAATGTQTFASLALGYLPGVAPDTPPANEASVLALPYANFLSQGSTVPRRITIPKRELVGDGQLKWYKTIAGAADSQFETQGIIYGWAAAAGSLTTGLNWMVHYTCQLQGWILAANTPFVVPKDVSKIDDHTKMLIARQKARASSTDPGKSPPSNEILDIAGVRYLRID